MVVRQLGMDHEREVRQVEATRCDVRRDEHAGAAVTQGDERLRALVLRQLAREGDRREAPLHQARMQPLHTLAGGAEHDRGARFMKAQHIDHRVLDVERGNANGAVFDVGVLLVAAERLDAKSIALIAACESFDLARHGGGEEQRLTCFRRRVENEFEILAEAEVQHLVGFIEHDGLELGEIEPAALEMIAKAPRRADDDVGAEAELACLCAGIHAADAGDDACTRLRIEPGQLALNLHGKLAGGRDDQRQRLSRGLEALVLAEHGGSHGQAEGYRLAGSGLGGDQHVAARGLRFEHGALHGGGHGVISRGQRTCERRMRRGESHVRAASHAMATAPAPHARLGTRPSVCGFPVV